MDANIAYCLEFPIYSGSKTKDDIASAIIKYKQLKKDDDDFSQAGTR